MIYKNEAFLHMRELCLSKKFVCKGTAFFRIHGDGVLQVIKVDKVRSFSTYKINFGLFSMYGNLQPSWFTSGGCIPRYGVVCFLDDAVHNQTGGVDYLGRVVPFIRQVDILNGAVFPFLDKIKTQEQLADGLCRLDVMMSSSIVWNDPLKLDAYLYSGDSECAIKVIHAILEQHRFADNSKKKYMDPLEFQKYLITSHERDAPFIKMLEFVMSCDESRIKEYLTTNYIRNTALARRALPRLHNSQ